MVVKPSFGTRSPEEFAEALGRFRQGCERIMEAYRAKRYPRTRPYIFRVDRDDFEMRARIVRGSVVHCFVDYATGDVWRAATWWEPEKTAYGNIYDKDGGLKNMGPYGPALRAVRTSARKLEQAS